MFYMQTLFNWPQCVFMYLFSLTFFPPCFSTMSVLSGKWSSWGVLEPPPLGIVQLSPRQASFTLPLHRHQPSGTKRKEEKKRWKGEEVSNWPLHFFENTFTHSQTIQPLAVHQALYFQHYNPTREEEEELRGRTTGWVSAVAGKRSFLVLKAEPQNS